MVSRSSEVLLPHENILNAFDPISLKEMDSVKLQDRVDTKFMFRETILPKVLKDMVKDYKILEVANYRYSNYETLYFDTDDFTLYRQHHNGKLNRFKFRSRKYVESNLHFFEVKFKSNKGRTVKERIKHHEIVKELQGQPKDFLVETSGHDPAVYKAQIWVNYRRHTFVSKTSEEAISEFVSVFANCKQVIFSVIRASLGSHTLVIVNVCHLFRDRAVCVQRDLRNPVSVCIV